MRPSGVAAQEGRERAVTDYISGMSDEFAIRTFEDVFCPANGTFFKKEQQKRP